MTNIEPSFVKNKVNTHNVFGLSGGNSESVTTMPFSGIVGQSNVPSSIFGGMDYGSPLFYQAPSVDSVLQNAFANIDSLSLSGGVTMPNSTALGSMSFIPTMNFTIPNLEDIVKLIPTGIPKLGGVSQTAGVSNTSGTSKIPGYKSSKIGKLDTSYWERLGYDTRVGNALANDAAKVRKGIPGQCVGYTRRTINRVCGVNIQNAGKAYQFGQNKLTSAELKGKFRKANPADIAKAGIPNGAVVLWAPQSPGFTKGKSATCGHGGIYVASEDGVFSNYIERRHIPTYHEIWIPVKT